MQQGLDRRARDIVCVGASAGGVLALARLVSQLASDFAAAVFIVLHGKRDATEALPAILARYAALPVVMAVHGETIVGRRIRTVPHDRHLQLTADGTVMGPVSREHGDRARMDELFRSAADAFGSRVIAVMLSGGAADGLVGLDAIRRAGGLIVVQSPSDAYASSMPLAAIAAGPIDHVVRLEEIGALLMRLTRMPAVEPAVAPTDVLARDLPA